MAKGFFTQSAIILLDRPLPLAPIQRALTDFRQLGMRENKETAWTGASEQLVIEMRPEVNGKAIIDVLESTWPDGMGDPKNNMKLFFAWSMGFFGPFVFPGNLERAVQHAAWPEAMRVVRRHQAFIRICTSYVLGIDDENAPVLPPDYDPVPELMMLTHMSRTLLRLPGALCYFNPNGETLHPAGSMDKSLENHLAEQMLPLDLWTNTRFFDAGGGWSAVDTVGMWQLDVEDHEACFADGSFEPVKMGGWLRDTTQYVLKSKATIKDGDTATGPGNVRWHAKPFGASLVAPPRAVLRWFPESSAQPPPTLTTEQQKA